MSDVAGNDGATRLGGITGRGFMPGRSGNPAGRNLQQGIQALARKYTPEAIAALVKALDNPKQSVAAATVLLAYGWGRPVQTVAAEDATSITFMHLVAMRQFSDELQAERAAAERHPTINGEARTALESPADARPAMPRNLMEPALE